MAGEVQVRYTAGPEIAPDQTASISCSKVGRLCQSWKDTSAKEGYIKTNGGWETIYMNRVRSFK